MNASRRRRLSVCLRAQAGRISRNCCHSQLFFIHTGLRPNSLASIRPPWKQLLAKTPVQALALVFVPLAP